MPQKSSPGHGKADWGLKISECSINARQRSLGEFGRLISDFRHFRGPTSTTLSHKFPCSSKRYPRIHKSQITRRLSSFLPRYRGFISKIYNIIIRKRVYNLCNNVFHSPKIIVRPKWKTKMLKKKNYKGMPAGAFRISAGHPPFRYGI